MAGESRSESSARLSRLVEERRVTQTSLSEVTGYSQPYISKVLRGDKVASPDFLDAISRAMGLDERSSRELHRQAADDHGRRAGYKLDLG